MDIQLIYYVLTLFFVCVSFCQTSALQQQLDSLKATVAAEFQTRDKHVLAHNENKVKELREGLSDLGEETKDLSHKVPHLESVVSFLSSKVHEERQRYNETLFNVEKTFSGLLHKIGALEGVIHELHMHHEQHEEREEQEQEEQRRQALKQHLLDQDQNQDPEEEGGRGRGSGSLGRAAAVLAVGEEQKQEKQKEKKQEEEEEEGGDDVSTVLLVVASPNRPEYLRRALSHIAKHHPK
jgi:chromosome segregation ATPase